MSSPPRQRLQRSIDQSYCLARFLCAHHQACPDVSFAINDDTGWQRGIGCEGVIAARILIDAAGARGNTDHLHLARSLRR